MAHGTLISFLCHCVSAPLTLAAKLEARLKVYAGRGISAAVIEFTLFLMYIECEQRNFLI